MPLLSGAAQENILKIGGVLFGKNAFPPLTEKTEIFYEIFTDYPFKERKKFAIINCHREKN